MCGIIGYVGNRSSPQVLLEGLGRMEYRGYDSAGLVVAGPHGFHRVRAKGPLQNLKQKLQQQTLSGCFGIAHIRWATHGKASEVNAHPHLAQGIYLVHNGVIENIGELKQSLKGPFVSDTDSEVLAHYLAYSYHKTGQLLTAVWDTIACLEGEYAVVAISEKDPTELIGFKKGPSLAIGLGENEVFIASDCHAFVSYTPQVIFLKDGEVVHIKWDQKTPSSLGISHSSVQIYSAQKKIIKKPVHLISPIPKDTAKKCGYPYYMLKEIYEQPTCVTRVLQTHIHQNQVDFVMDGAGGGIIDDIIKKGHLKLVACGSSYHTALYGKYVLEELAGLSVEVDVASEFRYRSPVLLDKPPVLVISQSGETADTLAVLRMSQELSCPTLSLCNVARSTIDQTAMVQLYMLAGEEKGVASTKSFSNTLVSLLLLAIFLGRRKNHIESSLEKQLVQQILQLPDQIKEVLRHNDFFSSVAHNLEKFKGFIYLGRGVFFPLALEGALKMKELTYKHAEGYPAGEMKHGPLALIDNKMCVVGLAPFGKVHNKTLTNLEEVHARGGQLIVIGTKGDKMSSRLTQNFLPLPTSHEYISAILSAIPLQLMAYHLACYLGNDVDRPRNLAKSVTVE